MEFQWNPRGGSSLNCFQVELEFGNVGFCGRRKTGEPGEPGENPQSRDENQQPGPHWWEASALNEHS